MSTGYKIEIVLMAIAFLLIGSIFVISKTNSQEPKIITTSKYEQTSSTFVVKININTANLNELMELDGIGEQTAKKIINYRNDHSFKKIEDIMNVSGIGKKKFEELLSGLIIKPQGKPVLAPDTDKRPELNTAANDFMEE